LSILALLNAARLKLVRVVPLTKTRCGCRSTKGTQTSDAGEVEAVQERSLDDIVREGGLNSSLGSVFSPLGL
jgi:hypothetical protein